VVGTDFGNVAEPGSISGQVWNDLNGNGIKDGGEPGMTGWTVYIDQNNNGIRDGIADGLEPDNYASGTILNTIKPGITLQTTSGGNVFAAPALGGYESTGVLAFSPSSGAGGWGSIGLRVNFATPTDFVSLDAISDDSHDLGRLQAFNSSGVLIATYNTGALGTGAIETMTITRPTADIAYVIASGVAPEALNFDNLHYGSSEPGRLTDGNGNYEFADLPFGVYNIRQVVQPGWTQTAAPGPLAVVPGAPITNADFGNHLAAPSLSGDYNQDGSVDAADYIIWRRMQGQTVSPPYSGADGDGSGQVDGTDYNIWTSHFGQTIGSGGGGGSFASESSAAGKQAANEPAAESSSVQFVPSLSNSSATNSRPSVNRVSPVSGQLHFDALDEALVAWLQRLNIDAVVVDDTASDDASSDESHAEALDLVLEQLEEDELVGVGG
jgi:hypothetical protein